MEQNIKKLCPEFQGKPKETQTELKIKKGYENYFNCFGLCMKLKLKQCQKCPVMLDCYEDCVKTYSAEQTNKKQMIENTIKIPVYCCRVCGHIFDNNNADIIYNHYIKYHNYWGDVTLLK